MSTTTPVGSSSHLTTKAPRPAVRELVEAGGMRAVDTGALARACGPVGLTPTCRPRREREHG